jgi:hypothetical protein
MEENAKIEETSTANQIEEIMSEIIRSLCSDQYLNKIKRGYPCIWKASFLRFFIL